MIGWMYSGMLRDTIQTLGGINIVGSKTGLRSVYHQTDGSSGFVGFATIDIPPNFIKNDALVAENDVYQKRSLSPTGSDGFENFYYRIRSPGDIG